MARWTRLVFVGSLVGTLLVAIAAADPPGTITIPGAQPGYVSLAVITVKIRTGHTPPTYELVKTNVQHDPTAALVAGFVPVAGSPGNYVGLAAIVNFNGLGSGPAANTSLSPGAVLRVKNAANYAIDRPAMLRQRGAFAGSRSDQILPPGMPGFASATTYPSLAGARVPAADRGAKLAADVVLWARGTPDPAFAQAVTGTATASLNSPTGRGPLRVTNIRCYANGTGTNAERDADLSLSGKAGWHFQQVFPASYIPGGSQSAPSFFLEDGPAPYNAPTTHIYAGFGVTVSGDVKKIASGQQVTVSSGLLDVKGNSLKPYSVEFDFRCP